MSTPPTPLGRLGAFDGLLEVLSASWPLFGADAPTGEEVSRRLAAAVGLPAVPTAAESDVRAEDGWTRDGLDGT